MAYVIVHMQRFAQYIKFSGAMFSSSAGSCRDDATVDVHWHGEEPVWSVKVDASHYPSCECLGKDVVGLAALDEIESAYPDLIYRLIDADQMLQMVDIGDCATDPCASGAPTRTLIVADGLSMVSGDCSAEIPCPVILKADGLTVDSISCDSTPESPGEDDTSDGDIRTLSFRAPFTVTVSSSCPSSAEISLPSNLVGGGKCVTVSSSGCLYEVNVDKECLLNDTSISGGTCIEVIDSGGGNVTINNTMGLTAGPGVAISGSGCNYTISASGTSQGIQAGDCISFDTSQDGKTVTINSDVGVLGGNGIIVTRSECDYVVSLAGSQGDPKTSIRFVCDIECVENSGKWSLVVKYGTIEMPTAILSSYTSECDGGSGSGSGGVPGSGSGGTNTGIEGSISFESIFCDEPTPHFAFTINHLPEGTAYYKITVTGDKGSSSVVGPSYNHEETPGQTYWGALADGWATPQPEECFSFSAQWCDADDNPVGDPITWEACCE